MPSAALRVQRTYLVLTLFTTLAASFIWGINTLFLLDAGLDNFEAFSANAFFTVGPGAVRDPDGRRRGHARPAVVVPARDGDAARSRRCCTSCCGTESRPFWAWAIASILLGLGFTFFSGATEAWLVDALDADGLRGTLETVFARGADRDRRRDAHGIGRRRRSSPRPRTSACRSCPRAALLGVTFVVAFVFMHDIGFTPSRGASVTAEVTRRASAHRSTAACAIRRCAG